MDKHELKEEILASISGEEWAALAAGTLQTPVNDFNRELLLRLRDSTEEFSGPVDEGKVIRLRETVAGYLNREWADEPMAHKYVVGACLALGFLYDLPLHPPASARYRTVTENGVTRYFCPAREPGEGSVCELCRAESLPPAEVQE